MTLTPTPSNAWTNFLALSEVVDLEDLYETRTINDASGNVMYVGYSMVPNDLTSNTSWFILKFFYDTNGFFNRKQLPTNGTGFKYSWDLVTTYFS